MVQADSRTLEIRIQAKDLVTQQLGGIGRSIAQVGQHIKAAFGQVVIGALRQVGVELAAMPARLIGFGRELIQEADHAQKMAAALGTTTESLTALSFAAKQAGVDQGGLETATRQLLKAIGEARDGSAKQVEAFEKLGISSVQLNDNNLDLVETYAHIADAISGVRDPIERTRILLDLFGKSGNEVANLLAEGGKGIRAMAKDAKELGVVLDQDLIRKADAAGDEFERFNSAVRGVFNETLRAVLPEFTSGITATVEFLKAKKEDIIEVFRGVAKIIVDSMAIAGRALIGVVDFFSKSIEGWKTILAAMRVGFQEFNQFTRGMFTGPMGMLDGGSSRDNVDAAREELARQIEKNAQGNAGTLGATLDQLTEDLARLGKESPKAAAGMALVREELIRSKTVLQGFREGRDQFAREAQNAAALAQSAAFQGLGALRDFGANIMLTLTLGANNFAANMRKVGADFLRLMAQIAANRTATALIGAILPAAGAAGASSTGAGSGAGGFSTGGGFGPSGFGGGGAAAFLSTPSGRKQLADAIRLRVRRDRGLRADFQVR